MEIKCNHLSYSYQKINYVKKEVLENIDISFMKGKINGIIGPSGSGKTTLLELLDALLVPTEGNITIDDYVIDNKQSISDINGLRFSVGLVFQFPEEQIFNKTVYDELAFGLKFFHYKEDQLDKRVLDALLMVGLDESYLNKDPFTLSSSEKRKVAIASILIINPSVLILDEPTIGLDSASKKSIIQLLRLLKNRYHKTIIIVSHDIDFLHKIVDHVFVLANKQIVLQGDKYEVFKQVSLLKKYGLKPPKVIEFSDKVLQKKNIKIGYRDEINDLIKDIYRYVK